MAMVSPLPFFHSSTATTSAMPCLQRCATPPHVSARPVRPPGPYNFSSVAGGSFESKRDKYTCYGAYPSAVLGVIYRRGYTLLFASSALVSDIMPWNDLAQTKNPEPLDVFKHIKTSMYYTNFHYNLHEKCNTIIRFRHSIFHPYVYLDNVTEAQLSDSYNSTIDIPGLRRPGWIAFRRLQATV